MSLEAGWRIDWVLFDLNGTLLDPSGIAEPLGDSDEDRRLVEEAFREALLLTMAATLSSAPYRPLPEYLRAALERRLRTAGCDMTPLDRAMERAQAMDPFPDAESALTKLRSAGLKLGVLTNSTSEAAEAALASADLRDQFEVVLGTDAVQVFKPHPRVYEHAVGQLPAEPREVALVAAHAWDVMGAISAGLRGAWVARGEGWLVPVVPRPDVEGKDLHDVAAQLAARARAGAR